MRISLSLIIIATLSGTLLSCKGSPKRPNFVGGKDSNVVPVVVPKNPTEGQVEGVNTVLTDDEAICKDKPRGFGRASLRLLTTSEYANSVKDILKTTEDVKGLLTPESKVNGFLNNVEANRVLPDHASAFTEVGISVADSIKPNLQSLVGCTEQAGAACAQKVVDILGPKFYRRPLSAEEKSSAMAIYQKGFVQAPREGMTLLITYLMTSPGFLYRSEIGDSEGKLDAYEIATALSYFFWGTTPDDALVAAAANGKLLTEEGMKAEALRLWQSPRSRFVTDTFAHSWLESEKILGSNKDPAIGAALTQDIKKAMYAEVNDTFDFLMRESNGTFETMLTTDFTIGSSSLATFYGVTATMDGGVSKLDFGTGNKGLVGLGGLLASHSSADESHPIKRGEFVLSKMLCFVPPPTPPGLDVVIPPRDPSKTTRERFAIHSATPGCAGCHTKLDGVGFGMEDYDTLGRFRSKDVNGKDIDASGFMIEANGAKTPFDGTADLSAKIGKSNDAKKCFAIQWYRLAHGRTMSAKDNDICATRDIASRFAKGEIALKDLLMSIISDSSYTKRAK